MEIAIVGPGRIGGDVVARGLAAAGHHVTVSFSRNQDKLRALADEIGGSSASPSEAVAGADVVVVAVPWSAIPDALDQMGSLEGRIVIDTTNQFGSGPMPAEGQTAASFNASRMAGARYTKSFNTLTSGFQVEVRDRAAEARVVQWICGDDGDAKQLVSKLIDEMGYVPVDLGGTADCMVMEAPRRPGAVYGEEWRLPEALEVVVAVREGRPIPETPQYAD